MPSRDLSARPPTPPGARRSAGPVPIGGGRAIGLIPATGNVRALALLIAVVPLTIGLLAIGVV